MPAPARLECTVQCPPHQPHVQAALVDENELVAALRDKLEAGEGRQEDLQAEVQHLQQHLRDLQAQRATAGNLAKEPTHEGHGMWQRPTDGSEQAQRELQVGPGVGCM